MRHAFTLIEMLVVVAVITALAGMSYPVLVSIRNKADISATTQLVSTVATAIESYQIKTITCKDGVLRHAWALFQDSTKPDEIDGDPRLYSAAHSQYAVVTARSPSWYLGLVYMTGFNVPSKTGLTDVGQLKDRWGKPLHIAWAAHTYGSSDFGVWSTGRDAVLTPPGTAADDICSWKNNDQ